jgi:tetratricopeptide (TPR) repeat protein
MIGTTLFIAGAEAAVSQQPDGLRAWQLDDTGELVECHRHAQMFLDCPSEKRVVHNLPDLKQLKLELQLWSAKQRTLYYLLAGMDRELRETTRSRRLLAAEEQLGDSACAAFVRARLLGCALPAVADLAGALILAQALPRCRKLYQELDTGKLYISTVKHALQGVIADNADQHFAVDEVYLSMLDHGVVAAAVGALAHNDRNGLEDLLWQFAPNKALIAACPQLSKTLLQLVKRLQPHLAQVAQLTTVANIPEPDAEADLATGDMLLLELAGLLAAHKKAGKGQHRLGAGDPKGAAESQKQFILTAHTKGQIGQVEQGLLRLMKNQLQVGKPEHLCKSLCSLAKDMVARHDFNLAMRLYDVAKLANVNDDVCHNGYAETLRALGQFDAALAAYREAKTRFPNDAVCHTGYAEALRSLGQAESAIAEYRLLQQRFPNDRVIPNALACLLIDKGSFAEAELLLSAANANAKVRDWFDYHVLAMLKLKLGQDDLAESMLRTGARTAPALESRTIFAHALSTYLLRQKRFEEAERALHNPDSHIITSAFTHLLQAHSLAASNKLPDALNWLNLAKPISGQTEELKDAIARRYGLAGKVAEVTAQWDVFIAEHEFNLALRMRQTSTLLMA